MTNRASFNLDTTSTPMIATGAAAPVYRYNPDAAPGTPRVQELNESGVPLWVMDCLVDDGADRANVAAVRIASPEQPAPARFQPVAFSRLVATVYVNKRQGNTLGLMYEGDLATASNSGRRNSGAEQAA